MLAFIVTIFCSCASKNKIPYVYSDGKISIGESAIYNINNVGIAEIVSVPDLNRVPLCSIPNCTHSSLECISKRFTSTPLIYEKKAYYFSNDPIDVITSDDQTDLKLGTTLYEYNFSSNNEKKIKHIDGVVSAEHGSIIINNKLYFIGNHMKRKYDETGFLIAFGNGGGKQQLISIDLESHDYEVLGDMYDADALASVYPLVANSGENYIRGIFDDKLFYDTAFATEENNEISFKLYTSYYDLLTKQFNISDAPNDMIYSEINYISEDYLAVSRDKELFIYNKTYKEPVVIKDENISIGTHSNCYVDDEFILYNSYVFDKKTLKRTEIEVYKENRILKRLNDVFITKDINDSFNIIPIPSEYDK